MSNRPEYRVAVWEQGRVFAGRFDGQRRVYLAPTLSELIGEIKIAATVFCGECEVVLYDRFVRIAE